MMMSKIQKLNLLKKITTLLQQYVVMKKLNLSGIL